MDQSVIDSIIKDIKASTTLDHSLNAFRRLSKEDKLKLLNSLKDIKNEAAGLYLNALYPGERDKDIQKQMRKMLFGLKTLGIKVEEPKETGEPALKRAEEVREHKALLSSYDSGLMRLLVAAYELKRNSFMFFNAYIHFSQGLRELTSGPVDGTGLKKILKEYRTDVPQDMVLANISPGYAAYLLEEASDRSGKYKEEIRQLKKVASGIKDKVRNPEDIYNLPMSDATRSLPIEKILEHHIFGPFILTWDTIEEDKKAYNGIGGSSIILPPYMVEEKRQAIIKRLLEQDELKSKIPLIKRLLEDYAYVFHGLNEFPYYKGLMECLRDANILSNILQYFIKGALAKSEEKQPGLIVGPYG